MSTIEDFQKHFIAVKYHLLGKKWYNALTAMEFAFTFHKGTRKDNVTPEFFHQVEVAGFLLTLSDGLLHPEDTITTSFLHDCPEDYDVGFQELESKFGSRVAKSTKKLTKVHRGSKINVDTYFNDMIEDPISSVVKGSDRIHNQSSIVGVFSREKQKNYIHNSTMYIKILCMYFIVK